MFERLTFVSLIRQFIMSTLDDVVKAMSKETNNSTLGLGRCSQLHVCSSTRISFR